MAKDLASHYWFLRDFYTGRDELQKLMDMLSDSIPRRPRLQQQQPAPDDNNDGGGGGNAEA